MNVVSPIISTLKRWKFKETFESWTLIEAAIKSVAVANLHYDFFDYPNISLNTIIVKMKKKYLMNFK